MFKFLVLSFLVSSSLVSATKATSCTPYSAPACPAKYNSCCAYLCGEAQVPFPVCQPTDGSGEFAQCSKCPGSTPTVVSTVKSSSKCTYGSPTKSIITITTVKKHTTRHHTKKTTKKPPTTMKTTSCTPYSASACPGIPNKCCAYLCGEAQVPFPICQPTDGSGQFAQCSKCPTTTSKPVTTTPKPTTSCSNYSAPSSSCPSKYDPCCKYKCAHAQVPYDVCQPTIDTVFAQCTACPTV